MTKGGEVCLYKLLFRCYFEQSRESANLIDPGKRFSRLKVKTANALSPFVLQLVQVKGKMPRLGKQRG